MHRMQQRKMSRLWSYISLFIVNCILHHTNVNIPPWSFPCTQTAWRTDLYQRQAEEDTSDKCRRGTIYVRGDIHCNNKPNATQIKPQQQTDFVVLMPWNPGDKLTDLWKKSIIRCHCLVIFSVLRSLLSINEALAICGKNKLSLTAQEHVSNT